MNPFDYAHDLITKENLDEDTHERKDYKLKFKIKSVIY